MNTIHPRSLKDRASSILESRTDFSKLVLIYAAISFGGLLLINLIQVLLNMSMTNQSGLSGMGISAMFLTAQSTLGTVYNLLMPFWEVGILYAAIRVTRQQNTEPSNLTQGFRRWGVILRFYILLVIAYFLVCIVLGNAIVIALMVLLPVYMMVVPLPENFASSAAAMEENVEKLTEMTEISDPTAIFKLLPVDVLNYVMPLMIFVFAAILVVMLHLYYRIRMSQYLLVDDPAVRARGALIISNQMTKGHKWKLFRLDLSFWWFFLLQAIAAGITFVPDILSLAGAALPMPTNVAYLLFQALSCGANVGILWLFGAKVQVTYACAYDVLRTPPQTITVPNM